MRHGLAVALAAVSALLAGTACTAQHTDSALLDSTTPSTLPLQSYLPSADQTATLAKARYLLVARCMRSYGITWTMPVPTAADLLPQHDPWPLFLNERDAADRGFDPPADQVRTIAAQQRNQTAWRQLTPDARAVYLGWDPGVRSRIQQGDQVPISHEHDGKQIPVTGCLGVAQATLGAGAPALPTSTDMAQATTVRDSLLIAATRIGTLSDEAGERAERDPRYVAMIGRWQACMRGEGFAYATPEEARDDRRWQGHRADATEIAAARSYARCLRSAGYLSVAGTLRTDEEHSLIASHQPELSTIRKVIDTETQTAAAVVRS